MVREATLSEKISLNIFMNASKMDRCPYLKRDGIGIYCSKGLPEGKRVPENHQRRESQEAIHLRVLCTKEYSHCTYYRGKESFD